MTAYSYATYSPFSVGLEDLLENINLLQKGGSTSYPPHNIIKDSDTQYRIEMAVAGLNIDDIDIEVNNGLLRIRYAGGKVEDKKDYVYCGISQRKFNKEFTLSEYVRVTNAILENGILTIQLEKQLPEELKPRKIKINQGQSKPEFLSE